MPKLIYLRLITAFLLLVLLLNSFFYCLYCNICIWQREASVEASIRNNTYGGSVTILKIPVATITAGLLNDDEITVNKRLYDVVKRQMIHDTVYLYTLPDDEEQSLVDKIDTYVSAGETVGKQRNCAVRTVMHAVKFLPQVYINRAAYAALLKKSNLCPLQYHLAYYYSYTYPDIPTPPPKTYRI